MTKAGEVEDPSIVVTLVDQGVPQAEAPHDPDAICSVHEGWGQLQTRRAAADARLGVGLTRGLVGEQRENRELLANPKAGLSVAEGQGLKGGLAAHPGAMRVCP